MVYINRYFIYGEIALTFKKPAPSNINKFFETLAEEVQAHFGLLSEQPLFQEIMELSSDDEISNLFGKLIGVEPSQPVLKLAPQEHLFIQTDLSDKELLLAVISLNIMVNTIGEDVDEEGNPKSIFSIEGLEAVAPNWLMVASDPEQSGLGGPGTYPVAVADADGDTHYGFKFYSPTNSIPKWGDFFTKCKEDKEEIKKDIVVAVLDTYPETNTIDAFKGRNSFLKTMLDTKKITTFHIAEVNITLTKLKNNLEKKDGTHIKGHQYKMSSHGLFVTSLIHMIAPEAQIKVYRVLNDYGIGTSYTIMRGLQQALDNHQGIPLVINLSLTMTFPFMKEQLPDDDSHDLTKLLSLIIDKVKAEAQGMAKNSFECGTGHLACQLRYPVQSVIKALKTGGVTIISAAGNEKAGEETPNASFPASFKEVIGVSALKNLTIVPEDQEKIPVSLTDYSSKADKPIGEGFAVFGGEISEPETNLSDLSKEKEENLDKYGKPAKSDNGGLVGLYIDDFPAPEKDGKYNMPPNNNSTGWAYWSGTSFAAPIITGAIAKLVICGESLPVAVLQNTWKEVSTTCEEVPHVVLAMQHATNQVEIENRSSEDS